MPERPTRARDWISLVLDPGWSPLFDDVTGGDPLHFPGYTIQVSDARAATGASESVLCAEGTLDGHRTIALAFEFAFLGGSMGVAAGERIARAFEKAAKDGAAVVAVTSSGGARIQEGMLALAQMPATVAARATLAEARRPFVAWLANPTTGGVYASFASLADLLWAEPGATVGFAGPRVAEAITGEPLPEGSHTAERAWELGIVDALVPAAELRARLAAALGALAARPRGPARKAPPEPPRADLLAWDQVQLARHPERPSGRDYLEAVVHDATPIRRGSPGEDDPTIACAVGRIGERRVLCIAQDRHAADGRTRPAGFRRARFAMTTAERLGLPIVTFVDTPGAHPGADSEAGGVAGEIARTFERLLTAPVPTVACVVGEGGSGGALALAGADRVVVLQNSIFSVIAPEGAAAILGRNDVAAVAGDLKLGAHDLRGFGLADLVVAEPPGGAGADPKAAAAEVERALAWALDDLRADRPFGSIQLVFSKRRARWREAGARHLIR